MRTVVLIAVSLLVAGCSHATVTQPDQAQTTASTPTASASTRPSAPASTSPTPAAPPVNGAPIGDVIGWIEAGKPADAAIYHSATRNGVATELGDGVAFTTPAGPSGPTSCATDPRADGALSCLANLADPPPRPQEVYGRWKGNWVDFDGKTLQVGSAHGDPGPFANGDGPELPDGAALSFGDYRCRSDRTGLFCVNYAHRSAVRFNPAGVAPFGCLHPVPAPADVGELFSC